MDDKQKTIDSYNKSAQSLAHKFDEQGARVSDINELFLYIKNKDPFIVEIGCGNGRDAKEILAHTNKYLGIDVSEELIRLAREKVALAQFQVADVEQFRFPRNIDAVIAFASLLHVDKEHFKQVIGNLYQSLNGDGLVRISLKWNGSYKKIEKTDQFGTRTFYLYSEDDIREILNDFDILKLEIKDLRGQKWLEVLARK